MFTTVDSKVEATIHKFQEIFNRISEVETSGGDCAFVLNPFVEAKIHFLRKGSRDRDIYNTAASRKRL